MSSPRCTIKDIARAAEVSLSTVSYALRNHPRIPAKTCQRIQSLAREMGYQRDPRISALMSVIAQGKPIRSTERIALVWPQGSPREMMHGSEIFPQIVSSVTERAHSLGYEVEQFWMEEDHLNGKRLSTILKTRNIRGLLFAPAIRGTSLEPGLEWGWFSTVIMGYAAWTPNMNRALPNHYHAVRSCLDYLNRRGGQRTAGIFSSLINRRTDFAQEAAFLTHHSCAEQARDLLFFHDEKNLDQLPAWLKLHRVDSIIFGRNAFYYHCLRTCPELIASKDLVTMEWEQAHQNLPGMQLRYDLVAMAAVDMLIPQLHVNETGPPSRPKTIMLNSDWRAAREIPLKEQKSNTPRPAPAGH